MVLLGLASIALAAVLLQGLRASRRASPRRSSRSARLPAPARIGRPDALRPLAGDARARRARRARVGARPARLRPPRRGHRGEALPGRARAARALVRLAAARPARGARVPRRARRRRPPRLRARSSSWRRTASRTASAGSSGGRCRSRASPRGSSSPLHQVAGLDIEMRSSHGSQNLEGTGPAVAAILLSLVQLAVLVWIWLRRPGTAEELVRWSAAAVVAFVALGKVLSPQFLIWLALLVPLVARPTRGPRVGAARRRARPDAALVPVALLGARARVRRSARRGSCSRATSPSSPLLVVLATSARGTGRVPARSPSRGPTRRTRLARPRCGRRRRPSRSGPASPSACGGSRARP